MNRIEFMEALSRLLQDIPEEDRIDALKYYNDYFDDAGSENEKNVIEELESPEKVAAKIKADRDEQEEEKKESYTESHMEDDRKNAYQDNGEYIYNETKENKPWTNKWLKVILIAAIILVGCPIIIPVAIGLLAAVVGILVAAFALFAAIVIGFAAVVMVGVVLAVAGIGSLFTDVGVGLAVFGAGMIIIAIGAIGTVAGIRLCTIVFPGMIRGIVWILRKPFHRKAVA